MKEEDGYDPSIEISPYPTLILLKYFLGDIQHCVTVVGKWIFDSNFPFAVPLAKDNLSYCCIDDNETEVMNGYKLLLKLIRLSQKIIMKVSFRS